MAAKYGPVSRSHCFGRNPAITGWGRSQQTNWGCSPAKAVSSSTHGCEIVPAGCSQRGLMLLAFDEHACNRRAPPLGRLSKSGPD